MIVVGACGVFDQDGSFWGVNWLTASASLLGAGVMVPLLCRPLSRRKRHPDQLGQWALITLTRKLVAAPPAAPSAVNPPAQWLMRAWTRCSLNSWVPGAGRAGRTTAAG
jgi:hypothetical protein